MASFTNFACRSGGSNLNSGSVDGSTTEPAVTALVEYTAGDWNSATDVYTAPIGADMTEAVPGRWASLFHDGDTAPTTNQYLVARITAVDSGARTITLSTTARALLGTEVATGTGNRTMRIGGAWAGMNAAVTFPATFVTSALTNASGHLPRVNYKNDQTYSITASLSGVGASTRHQGYTSAYGDLGKATLDGGTSGASYNLWGVTVGANAVLADWICCNNGATGSATGVFWNSSSIVERVVVHSVRGHGFQDNGASMFSECEAYSCNQANGAFYGFLIAGGGHVRNCIAHDIPGSSGGGFLIGTAGSVFRCIADTNTGVGFLINATAAYIENCDAYNNGSHGLSVSASSSFRACNSNFVRNGGKGISATSAVNGEVVNCGFGAGTMANTTGATDLSSSTNETGSVTYASDVTPWTDPANGDFRISLAAAKGAGRGAFTQTAASYAGTVGYPDIGAAQSFGGGGGNLINSQALVRGIVI